MSSVASDESSSATCTASTVTEGVHNTSVTEKDATQDLTNDANGKDDTFKTISPGPMERFLLTDPVYRELNRLRTEGWKNKEDDWYWAERRQNSLASSDAEKHEMFRMMQIVAQQLDNATGGFTLRGSRRYYAPHDNNHNDYNDDDDDEDDGNGDPPAVLDLALAPGGFADYVLRHNPTCELDGFTLTEQEGGHAVLVGSDPARLAVTTADVTNFMAELGVDEDEIPDGHPDANDLVNAQWPYSRDNYDLVIADGKPPTDPTRPSYRMTSHALRTAQIVLSLTKVRPGGTVVMLCFNSHNVRVVQWVRDLASFSDSVQLFKPEPMHAIKSSYYIVCRGVRPETEACKRTVMRHVGEWRRAVLYPAGAHQSSYDEDEKDEKSGSQDEKENGDGLQDGKENDSELQDGKEEDEKNQDTPSPYFNPWPTPTEIEQLIAEFGPTFISLARPVWEVQVRAMSRKWSQLTHLRGLSEGDRLGKLVTGGWGRGATYKRGNHGYTGRDKYWGRREECPEGQEYTLGSGTSSSSTRGEGIWKRGEGKWRNSSGDWRSGGDSGAPRSNNGNNYGNYGSSYGSSYGDQWRRRSFGSERGDRWRPSFGNDRVLALDSWRR